MRNFKKVMALAVSVAAICSSVSAFAELEYTYTGGLDGKATYTAGDNSLTIQAGENLYNATVLVLGNGIDATKATGDDILYINQYTEKEAAFANMGLKGTEALGVGTYAVRVRYEDENGDPTDIEGTIVATEKTVEEELIEVTFCLGDVNADDETDGKDATFIASMLIGGNAIVGDSTIAIGDTIAGDYKLGDVNADGETDGKDATFIASMLIGGNAIVGDSTIAIGDIVTVKVPAN